jgi:hypothetical protein
MEHDDTGKPSSGARPYRRRSALYRWMRQRHAQVAQMLDEEEPSWREVSEWLGRLGVCNTKGATPSAASARRVWAVVCRDIAVKQARAASGGKLPPSRIPPTVRPQHAPALVTSPSGPDPSRPWAKASDPSPVSSQGSPSPAPPAERPTAKEQLERIERKLASRDY